MVGGDLGDSGLRSGGGHVLSLLVHDSVRHLETDEGREEPARACPGAPAVAMGTHAVRSQLAAPVQGRELMSFPLCCRRW